MAIEDLFVDLRPRQSRSARLAQCRQDCICVRVAERLAENVPGRILAIPLCGQGSLKVFAPDEVGAVQHGIDEGQPNNVRLSPRRDGAKQTRLSRAQVVVDAPPEFPRFSVPAQFSAHLRVGDSFF